MLEVRIQRVGHRGTPLPLPRYQTELAAGMDLSADVETELYLQPGARVLVPTGIAVAIPPGFEGQVRPRSGLALRHGITVLNAPGTIDADYRGEIQVLLVHLGEATYRIERGERIAQLVLAPVSRVSWREENSLAPTERAAGGFGHTGGVR